jgi:regulatory helix-turn-helix LysR family protein
MDTIASMRAFVAVAKTGSFSAAAQKLDLVPSVITKRVTYHERAPSRTSARTVRQGRVARWRKHPGPKAITTSPAGEATEGSPA